MKIRNDNSIILFNEISSDVPEIEIEAGLKEMLGILNSKGLPTTGSCQGHLRRGSGAWVDIEGAHFKHYMKRNSKKMEMFLRAGEGLWYLMLCHRAESKFRGLGRLRPRLKSMKRIVSMNLIPSIHLHIAALVDNSSRKTKEMRAMERAASKYHSGRIQVYGD